MIKMLMIVEMMSATIVNYMYRISLIILFVWQWVDDIERHVSGCDDRYRAWIAFGRGAHHGCAHAVVLIRCLSDQRSVHHSLCRWWWSSSWCSSSPSLSSFCFFDHQPYAHHYVSSSFSSCWSCFMIMLHHHHHHHAHLIITIIVFYSDAGAVRLRYSTALSKHDGHHLRDSDQGVVMPMAIAAKCPLSGCIGYLGSMTCN